MPEDFSQWDYAKAVAALAARQKDGDEKSLVYVVEKDNWQNGDGWSGPQFTGADSRTANVLKEGINRDFTPTGDAASAVRRKRRGVVGREPGWIVTPKRKLKTVTTTEGEVVDETPTPKEQARIEEANDVLLDWWNAQRGLRVFRQMVTHFEAVGRGPLRLYWPPGELKGGRMPTFADFTEAAKRIFLLAPKPAEAAIITDTWSMKRAGVYTFEDEDKKTAIGLCYVNEAGKTVVKTLKQTDQSLADQAKATPGLLQRVKEAITGQDGDTQSDPALPLGGNLVLFEMDGAASVTESVRRQQKLLDKAGTMLSHGLDEAGFRQEIYFNTMPPGRMIKVDDPDNPGSQIEVFAAGPPTSMPKGAGARIFAQGTSWSEVEAATGKRTTHLATPSHEVVDAAPVSIYTESADFAERNLLKDMDQLHVQIAGDAMANGISRQQARDDYEKSLDETGSEVDYVGSSVMETFLSLVAIFAGKPGYFDGLRVSFTCRIDPGPLAEGDRRMNIDEMKEGIKSVEEAMQYAGVTDPDAMKKKILEEQKEKLKAGIVPPPVDDRTGDDLPA